MGEVSEFGFLGNWKAIFGAWELGKATGFKYAKYAVKPGGPVGGIRDAMVDLRFALAQRPLELGLISLHYSKTSIARVIGSS